jgi:hypothetical protein
MPHSGFVPSMMSLEMPHLPASRAECSTSSLTSLLQTSRRRSVKRQAMIDELKSIEDNGTWELTSLPAGQQAIGLKWVYKVERDEAGNIVRHKAQLVAKG